MADDFYLTLMSNSSYQWFPENKTSTFTVKLPQQLRLDKSYEVALCEITYPMTIENVTEDNNGIIFASSEEINGHKREFQDVYRIEIGHYKSIPEIVYGMNKSLKEKIPAITKNLFTFDERINRITTDREIEREMRIFLAKKWNRPLETFQTHIHLENRLAVQLGYEPGKCIVGNSPTHQPSLNFGFSDTFMIYMDILEPQIIGDTHGQVLKVMQSVDQNHRFGELCTRTYTDRCYLPLLKTDFDTISIDIRQSSGGRLVPFQFGSLYILVHLRRSNKAK